MQLDLLQLATHSQSWTLFCAGLGAGGVWVNYVYMRKSMVTKKDVENALLTHTLEMEKKFVTRRECDLMMNHRDIKPNGGSKGAALGS